MRSEKRNQKMLKLYTSTFVMKKIRKISLSDREEKRRICYEQKQSDVKIGHIKVNIEKVSPQMGK